ncbi:MAG: adenylate/guanylate cyclase domain-containing protein [Mycobacterium sp.]
MRRRGDIFGSTVNIAARLAAVAQAGQVVTDANAASALGGSHLVTATSVGPLRLRNLGALV